MPASAAMERPSASDQDPSIAELPARHPISVAPTSRRRRPAAATMFRTSWKPGRSNPTSAWSKLRLAAVRAQPTITDSQIKGSAVNGAKSFESTGASRTKIAPSTAPRPPLSSNAADTILVSLPGLSGISRIRSVPRPTVATMPSNDMAEIAADVKPTDCSSN
jgi:hypothetical protein